MTYSISKLSFFTICILIVKYFYFNKVLHLCLFWIISAMGELMILQMLSVIQNFFHFFLFGFWFLCHTIGSVQRDYFWGVWGKPYGMWEIKSGSTSCKASKLTTALLFKLQLPVYFRVKRQKKVISARLTHPLSQSFILWSILERASISVAAICVT